jgi:ABC-2 type transport system permease protein
MSDIGLALRQVRYENRAFWRNPAAAFFTFVFPLLFMVIFNTIFGGASAGAPPGQRAADFFTPAIIVFSVINATFTSIVMIVTSARESGILKRVRGTPLPPWAYLAGRIGQSVSVAILLVVVVAAFGALLYEVEVPWARLPALLVTLAVGAAAFCALGLAVTAFVPNEDAAPAVANAVMFPLLFISNVFVQIGDESPEWIQVVSNLFPVRHFADAMMTVYRPDGGGSGFSPDHLAVMAAWGLAGLLVAVLRFRWEPQR